MQPHSQNMLPNGAILQSMSIQELMDATLRLSDVLTEETDLIRSRRYNDAAKLHDEKLRLSGLLETYQAVLATKPDFIRNADEKTREEAKKRACDVPLEIAKLCYEAIDLTPYLVLEGNKFLVSDVEVALELLGAAFKSAMFNVRINQS